MRYRDTVRTTVAELAELGIEALFPNLDYGSENEDKADSHEEKKRLAEEHYDAINTADCVYFITPGGYMGTSCKLELGYALACEKPIYFSEPTKDLALDCYVKEFIPLSSLDRFLKL